MPPALRVAIIGLGPKGMFALERLLDHGVGLPSEARIEVDVFEPHSVPGAGPIYDPGQPAYLRMNFAADKIDMWGATNEAVPRELQHSFVSWHQHNLGSCGGEFYPARADVGRYLAEGFGTLLRHTPPSIAVKVCRFAAVAVRRNDDGLVVEAADSSGRYDEVLIATGHAQSWDGGLAEAWQHSAPLVPAVFPVEQWLARERVPAGATVAIRGFALTFVDAALALTEGRGGSFETLDHPYRLRYVPGDGDAGTIIPFSRTGRPMLAKPGSEVAATTALEEIAQRARAALQALQAPLHLRDDVLPILVAATCSSLRCVGGKEDSCSERALSTWLTTAMNGASAAGGPGVVQRLTRSLDVSAGLEPPDLAWAFGHCWRSLYPAIVARLGGVGLADRDWPPFRSLAGEAERVSFGPSPLNAAKLLALIEAGRVDVSCVAASRLVSDNGSTVLRSEIGERAVDVVVDAVLPGPGAQGRHTGLLAQLLADGDVRVLPGRRGIDVDTDGGCRGSGGTRTPGLAAIGRPTEDAVIGNDTLSRTLHPLADRWATRIVQRSLSTSRVAVGAGGRLGSDAS
ncbi:FAD/NAD(P)-binding protein [Gaiella sp.]|uniref:FAD/NAD(P)-binding protein n=1 Tax=Gaiella sp. TaxID=2663207 RepID=UPI003263D874